MFVNDDGIPDDGDYHNNIIRHEGVFFLHGTSITHSKSTYLIQYDQPKRIENTTTDIKIM